MSELSPAERERQIFNGCIELLTSGGPETQIIAVSRAGALLSSICRMTTNPVDALEFAVEMLKERLESERARSR